MPRAGFGRGAGFHPVVVDGQGRPASAGGLVPWLRRVAPRAASGVMTIALASDAQVRALNRRHRGIDEATDVLSFPGEESAPRSRRRPRRPLGPPGPSGGLLGEVVIATGEARRQAKAAGHSYQTELRLLALHGLLHLLGFDHERDQGRMAKVERRLRRLGGLQEGLIERAS